MDQQTSNEHLFSYANIDPICDYEEHYFSFPNGHHELAATLTIPHLHRRKHPAAILIHGSGPFTRDAVVHSHRPFQVIADYLARRGIAVMRYDKRGVGGSTGTLHGVTTFDLADDTASGVNFMKQHSLIDSSRIGLIGHSEGGIIASMVASQMHDLAFAVLLGAPTLPGEEILLAQRETFSRAKGFNDTMVERKMVAAAELFKTIKHELTMDNIEEKLELLVEVLNDEDPQPVHKHEAITAMTTPWFKTFLSLNPCDFISEITIPLFALYGSLDTQVLSQPNLKAVEQALKGKSNLAVHEIPGLNHMLQHCWSGLPAEYQHIPEAIAGSALAVMCRWIAAQIY